MSATNGDDPDILSVATSIADGKDVDWDTAEHTTADARVLDELKVIDSLSRLTDKIPDTWGRLTIADEIGRGSHGTVYRAHDPALGIDLALKVVRPRGPGSQVLAATALNEAHLLARVNHPNVVRVFGAETVGDDIGITMELVEGRTIRERLREECPLSGREATRIGIDVARALTAVHEADLVHADIKAGNVMEASNGRTVLMDFGVGCDQKGASPAASLRAGTPLYQAPELFRGADVSPQSDIYSLGVLLFHMVTGGYPIDAHDTSEVERHHRERRPARQLRDLRPELPSAFIDVVNRALAEKPEDRFRSARDMEAALKHADAQPFFPPIGWVAPLAAAATVILAIALYAMWPAGAPVEDLQTNSRTSDLAKTVAVPPAARGPYTVEAAFYRHGNDGDVRLAGGERVRTGDAISLQVRSSVPVYTYVVNEDDKGKAYLLFPLPSQKLTNPLPAGLQHQIPGLVNNIPVRWEVSSVGGQEHFLVFVSPEPPTAEFQQMIAALPTSSFYQPQEMGNELVGALRGVGGLIKAPPAAERRRLSDDYREPLLTGEQPANGWWVRQLTVLNPEK